MQVSGLVVGRQGFPAALEEEGGLFGLALEAGVVEEVEVWLVHLAAIGLHYRGAAWDVRLAQLVVDDDAQPVVLAIEGSGRDVDAEWEEASFMASDLDSVQEDAGAVRRGGETDRDGPALGV